MQTEKDKSSSRHLFSETAGIKVTTAFVWLIIGWLLDLMFDLFPYLTILSSTAGLVQFIIFYARVKKKSKETTWPIIEASVDQIKKAVRTYSEHLPKGVYRTILVKEDNRIDMEQLAPLLKGIPSRNFYMSKETYDIFTEEEKNLAITIDKVQKAVDLYVKEHKEYPMLPYDPLHRVNYYQLLNAHCLDIQPEIELYITNYDGLITHKKPEKNSTGN
ncbi:MULTISPECIES: DUF3939 domain-containing protein [unclassified Bacillus (in: firmicutes)]|uniref:DUF3939 domain-containing protein n=1 Tax=unclassified Bacillus (in: firmicutes) TaxID=185979 RepID=UPI001BECEA66|nr:MULTISPECIES: DUF3939 domain-containing protein [unclassified Bacillus (in: firmicutes)]MBT2640315.1 DUF3939 domain-containing protein [Bacillus sp. ISL-39]MBT2662725.1 DUF3939 domain-containing protein [Bacillus sp. ISL-45]